MRPSSLVLLVLVSCAGSRASQSPPQAQSVSPSQPVAREQSVPPAPPPPLRAAAPLAAPIIPDALPATDPSLLAVLRVRDPVEVAKILGFDVEKILPGFTAGDLRPGAVAAFAWSPPPSGGDKPAVLGLLRTAPDSSLAQRLRTTFPRVHFEPFGTDTAFSPDAATLSRRQPNAAELRALAQTSVQDDVSLQINVTPLLARYGSAFRQFLDKMQAQVDAQSKDGTPIDSTGTLRTFLDGLQNVDTVTIGARILADSFAVSLVTRDKTLPTRDVAPSGRLAGSGELSPDLVRFLPAGFLRMQATGRLAQKGIGLTQGVLGSLMKTNPELFTALSQNMAEQAKLADDMQAAVVVSLPKERLFHFVQVLVSSKAEIFRDLSIKGAAMLADPSTQASMKKTGISCSGKVQRGLRTIEGWPMDHVEIDCKPLASTSPAVTSLLEKLYPASTDLLLMGNYLVTEFNGSGVEMSRIASEIMAGKPSGRALVAMEAFRERGIYYGDLDVAQLVNGIDALIPDAPGRLRLPHLDPALPPIVTTMYESGAVTEYRGRISKSVIAAIGKVFAQFAPTPPPAPAR
jgi:hypothetical protein